ncbi:MAG: SMP-30/gluconolactonase/LRE family protein [Rhizobiales bacterium]|nr:SMP-30/gluconolactonase/LRE family protein [Hyphomicrobiales bacterium]MBN9008759.1 SMP-30/gluconolactonase/LRE family protein [Hyphomicrobiales bacterium]
MLPPVGAPVLPVGRAGIFFDGQYSDPRIHHPEGVAVGPDGAVWCGNAEGDLLRIERDGSRVAKAATMGGFTLGLAFDGDGHLFACDQRCAAVWRLTLSSGAFERFTTPGIRIPNYPVVDGARNCLYVSDSFGAGTRGPGVWRYDLATGSGGLWWPEPMNFANGMALALDGSALFVIETFDRKVSRIAIGADGEPAGRTDFVTDLAGYPDGLAFDDGGNLYVSCYNPSRIFRVDPAGKLDLYIEDTTSELICHPTNIAFDGDALYTANLGRWHIVRISSDTRATSVVARVAAARSSRA